MDEISSLGTFSSTEHARAMLRAAALRALSGALTSTSTRINTASSFAAARRHASSSGGKAGGDDDDDGHDPYGDCTSSGWEGTEGAGEGTEKLKSPPTTHDDDSWEANFEDLMAMEDSYGSGVEDLSTAAMEMANARMAEQKRLQEEMRRLRGVQPGDRVRIRVRHGAPYPDPIKRYHYTSPFGGAGLGHDPGAAAKGGKTAASDSETPRDEEEIEKAAKGDSTTNKADAARDKGDKRRWKIVVEIGYVTCVRGQRVGIKRNGHPEDTDTVFPTYPKSWVEVLNVGEMWDMKTGPRNLGAFASEEDYAQAQEAWAEATNFGNDAGADKASAAAAK